MFLQPYRLPSVPLLLTLVSALAPVYPPPGAGLLKPRYLATGTGISTPATNTTRIAGSSSTAAPTAPATAPFYILTSAQNASLSDKYVFVGPENDGGFLSFMLSSTLEDPAGLAIFNLNATGTLFNEWWAGIACVYPGHEKYPELTIEGETDADEMGYPKTYCEVGSGGELSCETQGNRVFSVCPDEIFEGTPVGGTVRMGPGPGPDPDCTVLKLRVVPV